MRLCLPFRYQSLILDARGWSDQRVRLVRNKHLPLVLGTVSVTPSLSGVVTNIILPENPSSTKTVC